MNKQDLIDRVAGYTGMAKKDCSTVLEGTLHSITQALGEGEPIKLTGFGSFEVKRRAARVGRNPLTQETVAIPPQTVPVFKAGRALKDIVAGLGGE